MLLCEVLWDVKKNQIEFVTICLNIPFVYHSDFDKASKTRIQYVTRIAILFMCPDTNLARVLRPCRGRLPRRENSRKLAIPSPRKARRFFGP